MTSTTLPRSRLSEHLFGWQGGNGPPLLLIHGVGLNADAWEPLITYLKPHFAITAIDLPGHDESPICDAHNLSDLSDKICHSVPDQCFVVGHSLGALLTLQLTQMMGNNIAAISPLNAIFRRSAAAHAAVKARASALSDTQHADHSATLERWFGAGNQKQHSDMSRRCEQWLSQMNPRAYKQAYTIFAHANGPSDDALKAICCPSIFITGAEEPNSTPEMSENLAKSIDDAKVEIIPHARHMMPMTHAHRVAEILIDFYHTKVLSHV